MDPDAMDEARWTPLHWAVAERLSDGVAGAVTQVGPARYC